MGLTSCPWYAILDELYSVFYKYFRENWLHYNRTTLQLGTYLLNLFRPGNDIRHRRTWSTVQCAKFSGIFFPNHNPHLHIITRKCEAKVWGVFCEFNLWLSYIPVTAVLYTIWCYIRPHYSGTQLYNLSLRDLLENCVTMGLHSNNTDKTYWFCSQQCSWCHKKRPTHFLPQGSFCDSQYIGDNNTLCKPL